MTLTPNHIVIRFKLLLTILHFNFGMKIFQFLNDILVNIVFTTLHKYRIDRYSVKVNFFLVSKLE